MITDKPRRPAAWRGGRVFLISLFALVAAIRAAAAEAPRLETCYFRSTVLPPAAPEDLKTRVALQAVRQVVLESGEPAAVDVGLQVAPLLMGMSREQVADAAARIRPIYARMAADPTYRRLPSALPYSFSVDQPEHGRYTLIVPPGADAQTPVLIFLHGRGGSLMLYPWMLQRHLGDCIVAIPSWGQSWLHGEHAYLAAMRRDMERRLGFRPALPWLLGLADGGIGGFRVYTEAPQSYAGLLSVSGALPKDALDGLRRDMRVFMLNARQDPALPEDVILFQGEVLGRMLPAYELQMVDGDNLFILRDPDATFDVLRGYMRLPRRD